MPIESLSSDDCDVARIFAAMKLAEITFYPAQGWNMDQRTQELAKSFKTLYKAIRDAEAVE